MLASSIVIGFAFVGFDDEAPVQRLINMHFLNLNGKQIEIKAMEPPNYGKRGPAQGVGPMVPPSGVMGGGRGRGRGAPPPAWGPGAPPAWGAQNNWGSWGPSAAGWDQAAWGQFAQWSGQNAAAAAGWDQSSGGWGQANWGNPAAAAANGPAGWNAGATASWDPNQAASWGAAAGQQGNFNAYAAPTGAPADYGRNAVNQHSYHPYKR